MTSAVSTKPNVHSFAQFGSDPTRPKQAPAQSPSLTNPARDPIDTVPLPSPPGPPTPLVVLLLPTAVVFWYYSYIIHTLYDTDSKGRNKHTSPLCDRQCCIAMTVLVSPRASSPPPFQHNNIDGLTLRLPFRSPIAIIPIYIQSISVLPLRPTAAETVPTYSIAASNRPQMLTQPDVPFPFPSSSYPMSITPHVHVPRPR